MANPKHKTQRPNANPRTLVPAKLKMMPNGKIVVLLSPGAMAKMRVGNPTRYGDLYTVYRKEGRYSWEQTGHNFSSKSDANGQITIWKRGDRRDPPPYPKYKIVKLVKEYSRGNPMRQWDVRVPPTMQLGSYRFGPVRKTMAEAKRAALSEYNDSRRREGLPTLKSLPRGTTVKEYSR